MEFTLRIEGYLAKDAVHRTFDDGNEVTNLRVLHTRRFFDSDTDDWTDGKTISLDVACWGELAGPNADLRKGTKVLVECSDVSARAWKGRGYTQATAKKITITAPPRRPTPEPRQEESQNVSNDDDQAYAEYRAEQFNAALAGQ